MLLLLQIQARSLWHQDVGRNRVVQHLTTREPQTDLPLMWLCFHSFPWDLGWDLFIFWSHLYACNYHHANYLPLQKSCFCSGELSVCWRNLTFTQVFLTAQLEANFEEMENHLLYLEELCEQCELERYKCMQKLQLENYKKTKR